MEHIKKVLLEAAHEAGALMLERFQGLCEIEHKEGINNLVTEVDTACEAVIINKHDEYDDFHSVHYTELIPHLVNCIKELYKEIQELKK